MANIFEIVGLLTGLRPNTREVTVYNPPPVDEPHQGGNPRGEEVIHPNHTWMQDLLGDQYKDWAMVDTYNLLDVGDLAVKGLGWLGGKRQFINLPRYFDLQQLQQIMAASLTLMAEGGVRPGSWGIHGDDFERFFANVGVKAPSNKPGWVHWDKVDEQYRPQAIQYLTELRKNTPLLRNVQVMDLAYSAMVFAVVVNGGKDDDGTWLCGPGEVKYVLSKKKASQYYTR